MPTVSCFVTRDEMAVIPIRIKGRRLLVRKAMWDMLEGSQDFPPNFATSNGCTMSPDRIRWAHWKYQLWPACAIHDWRYYRGGSRRDRRRADAELRRNLVTLLLMQGCPWHRAEWIAWVYWFAVRRLGASHFNFGEVPNVEGS